MLDLGDSAGRYGSSVEPKFKKFLVGKSRDWTFEEAQVVVMAWPVAAVMLDLAVREMARLGKMDESRRIVEWNRTKAHLWFGIHKTRRFRHIARVFKRARRKYHSGRLIFIRGPDPNFAASTIFGSRLIFIHDQFFEPGKFRYCRPPPPRYVTITQEQTGGETIVHEIVHTVSNTPGILRHKKKWPEVYGTDALARALTHPWRAVHNAENYARYAHELWIDHVHKGKSAAFRKCMRATLYREA